MKEMLKMYTATTSTTPLYNRKEHAIILNKLPLNGNKTYSCKGDAFMNRIHERFTNINKQYFHNPSNIGCVWIGSCHSPHVVSSH